MAGHRPVLRAVAPALMVLVLGCVLSLVGARWFGSRIDRDAEREFQRISAETAAQITQRFKQPLLGLNGMRGLFSASQKVNRAEIHDYIKARDLLEEYSGVRAFGFVKPVHRKDIAAFTKAERADGAPDFTIRQLANKDLDELLVITAIAPASSNARAVGLDVGSDATRKAGAQLAIDTGSAALTGAIDLVQVDRKTPAFLMFLPIFKKGLATSNTEERRRALQGLAFATIVIDELLSKLTDVKAGLLDLELFDSSLGQPEGPKLFDTREQSAEQSPHSSRFTAWRALDLPGRTLALRVNSTRYFDASADHTTPWLLGGSGALISAMLALLFYQQGSGRRRAEQLVQTKTADLNRMAQVVKLTSSAVLMTDPQGRITWINEGFSRMTGYSATEAIGKTAGELLGSGKADPEALETLADTVANGSSCRVEILNRAKGGREYWAEIEIQPERDAHGVLTGFLEIGTDITQRRESEAQAVRDRELLRGSIDALDEAFVLYDPQDRLVLCNDKYREVYSEVAHLIVPGALFEDIIRAGAELGQYSAAVGRVDEWVKERVAAHLGGNATLIQRQANGRTLRIVERKLADGHIVGFRIDITDLVDATDAAQAASRAKSQFLANMSHEIRTPMNAILGMLTLLRKTELSARQADYAVKSEGAAQALLRLLNDILDFSKIEAGKMTLDPQPFGFEQILNNLSVILSTSTGHKPVEVLFDIDAALPVQLVGDAMRLQQVLLNLGGNAVKFTEQGEVVLRVGVIEQSRDAVTLRISVRDSGIGIAPENQARIFKGFTQAEASTTRRFGGTGLGVAISQRLVSLMGAELELQSTPGEGSCFFFTLTLPVCNTGPIKRAPSLGAGEPPPRVLIIDDNPTAREVLQRTCQSLGWTADTCEGGAAALARLQTAHVSETPYQAIFVDWQMPGMDGWQTVQALRESEEVATTTMIAMVTGTGRETLLQRSQSDQALLDDYLVKPLTASMLLQSLQKKDHANQHVPSVPPAVSAPRLTTMRILVVEDNINNQQVARELLQGEGALVRVANDGQAGVHAIANAKIPFDVVLMDLQMPVMDGLEATRVIRQDMGLKDLPIVAMTANAMKSDREVCLAAGMNEHIGKPFDLNALVRLLREQAGWRPVVDAASPVEVALPDPVLQSAAAGVDIEAALHRLGGNQAVYEKLLTSFVRDLRAMPAQLERHIGQEQVKEASRLLHTLKGLAATMGSSTLAERAAAGEKMMAGGASLIDVSAAAEQVRTAIEAALPGLDDLQSALALARHTNQTAAEVDNQPANANALQAALQTLREHLSNSDMAALQAMADLHQRHGSALGEKLVPLQAAVDSLDFAGALPLCEALMAQRAT